MDNTTDEPDFVENGDEDGEEADNFTNRVIMITAYVIILVFAVVGNSLVIHIIRTRAEIRKNSFNWLLVNTAFADLVDVVTVCAFSLPYYLCGECWLSGVIGNILCKVIPFLLVVSICVSIWTLTVIAVDRYLSVVCIGRRPLSSMSKVRSIIAVWLCAGLIFAGQLYKFKTEETDDGESVCYPADWHEDPNISSLLYKVEMIVRVVIAYAVPLVIMAALYSMIAHFLWSRKPPGDVNERAYVKKIKKRRVIIKMMVTVVTVFAICWLPVHVNHIMSEFYIDAYDSIPTIVRWFFNWLAHANAAIHPWLFIAFSEKLRVEVKGIFRSICKVCQPKRRSMPLSSLADNDDASSHRSRVLTAVTKNGSTAATNTL